MGVNTRSPLPCNPDNPGLPPRRRSGRLASRTLGELTRHRPGVPFGREGRDLRRAEPGNRIRIVGQEPLVLGERERAGRTGLAAEVRTARGGLADAATPARPRAAAAAGVLPDDDASTLVEAFDVLAQIRLRHQCEQLERGEQPVPPSGMRPLRERRL
ncbi:hypothetical protein FK531_17865 [Rhodococcus spelaei]|uniref:DUF294 domain-containing protein n=1 Tax=Rhodococcus spelaei TaxID=2546320 RepID=A0A541B216_9NOCA|nr:hypothetical protein FK531_17865 [Rhodococcus spelaei]